MAVPLTDLTIGQIAEIESVLSRDPALCNKLLSMGLVKGTVVELVNVAPLGDPLEIRALGYKLSLRASEASHVCVIVR